MARPADHKGPPYIIECEADRKGPPYIGRGGRASWAE